MNPVMMCCFNNLELTKRAVESVFAQDIPVQLWLVDNGSTDGTREWLQEFAATSPDYTVVAIYNDTNISPCKVANDLMARIFRMGYPAILGVPNDVYLPPNLYSEFLRWPAGIITGSMTGEKDFTVPQPVRAVSESTPMAVALIRKWAYDALVAKDGYFLDEGFFHYASDCDLALRMSASGIRGRQLDLPYWHSGSASWRLAPPEIARKITRQADVDRAYFQKKWGFRVGDAEYGQRCADLNFKG